MPSIESVTRNIKHHLLEKKYGPRVVKRTFLTLFCIYALFAGVATVTNHLVVEDDEYAAIMLSGYAFSDYDYWASPLAFLGSYPAWTIYFNLMGIRTDYVFNATLDDLKGVLADPKYQSIVLVGHGSQNVWRATDLSVSNYEIKSW